MGKMKIRHFFIVCGGLLTLFVLAYLVIILCIGPSLNERKATQLEYKLMAAELPQGVEFIEAHAFSGNTSGTGNHVEIWGGMLVQTDQDLASLRMEFPEMSCMPISLIKENGYFPLGYEKFAKLDAIDVKHADQYFMMETYEDAVTQWDIRGH